MSNRNGKNREHCKLSAALAELFRCPRTGIQGATGRGIPLKEAFHATKHLFDEHGLRAGPATPNPSCNGCDEKKAEAQAGNEEEAQPKVLRHQREPKKVSLPVFKVQEYRRIPIDRDKRQQHINCDQSPTANRPPNRETSPHIGRMNKIPGTVIINGGDRFACRLVRSNH